MYERRQSLHHSRTLVYLRTSHRPGSASPRMQLRNQQRISSEHHTQWMPYSMRTRREGRYDFSYPARARLRANAHVGSTTKTLIRVFTKPLSSLGYRKTNSVNTMHKIIIETSRRNGHDVYTYVVFYNDVIVGISAAIYPTKGLAEQSANEFKDNHARAMYRQ